MPTKPLYQQAVEIYHSQKVLSAYDVGNDNLFLEWYHRLSIQDQRVLHESARQVVRFAEELVVGLVNTADLLQSAEFSQTILDKSLPSTLLNELNIDAPNVANENDDYDSIGTDSIIIPNGDDEADQENQEKEYLMDQALKMYSKQQSLGNDSFNEWLDNLGAEDKQILQESLQACLAIMDDITRSFSDVVYNVIQLTKEHIEEKFLSIQELYKQ